MQGRVQEVLLSKDMANFVWILLRSDFSPETMLKDLQNTKLSNSTASETTETYIIF